MLGGLRGGGSAGEAVKSGPGGGDATCAARSSASVTTAGLPTACQAAAAAGAGAAFGERHGESGGVGKKAAIG